MTQTTFKFQGLPTVTTDFERTAPALVEQARSLPSSTLHEAGGQIGVLPPQIKPVHPSFSICGPAVTVHSPPGDNLWVHRAIAIAQPGDVLVVFVDGVYEHGYWGEIMSTAAKARNLGGLVMDGFVRDAAVLPNVGFPVFARGLCIRGTGKSFTARGWINSPVTIGETTVHAGDLVVGDIDGVVAIPRANVAATIAASHKREEKEADIMRKLRAGGNTIDLYAWDR
jgi:4-hydroxy-4-methyl-2-oxoglutarate aldolase